MLTAKSLQARCIRRIAAWIAAPALLCAWGVNVGAASPAEAVPVDVKPALPDSPASAAPAAHAPSGRHEVARPDAQVLLSQLYPDLAAAARPALPPAVASYTITPRAQAPAGEIRMAGAAIPALPPAAVVDGRTTASASANSDRATIPAVQLALNLGNGFTVPLIENGPLVASADDPSMAAMLASAPPMKITRTPVAVNLPLPVHVNKADAETIARELKIDARRARFIIEFRQAYGSFKSPEDLAQVYGITDEMLKGWEDRGRVVFD